MKRSVQIGALRIGGGTPVRVESMLKVSLSNREACAVQCASLLRVGCEMARVALPRPELASDLKWLVFNTDLTLMADIHFYSDRKSVV